jgi:hypothetical protein
VRAVNLQTGKPNLSAGYARTTINHTLTVVSGFYDFHLHCGSVDQITRAAMDIWPHHRRSRHEAIRALLNCLAGFGGETWQERGRRRRCPAFVWSRHINVC